MEDKNFTILCVDDEKSILNALKRLLRREGYNLLFADSGKEGLEILENNEVHMVISDQRMPEMSGTEFLSKVKHVYPDVFRVILTGYSDIDSITESINKGNIYKFFFKPWNDLKLKAEIRQILNQYELSRTNKQLGKTVSAQKEELQEKDNRLEEMVGTRTRELELQNHMLKLSQAILNDLPISVIGIDIEGIIVFANKMALTTFSGLGVQIGRSFSDFFPEPAFSCVRKVFETGEPSRINGQDLDFNNSKADLLPLSGDFEGKGVIMTLSGL